LPIYNLRTRRCAVQPIMIAVSANSIAPSAMYGAPVVRIAIMLSFPNGDMLRRIPYNDDMKKGEKKTGLSGSKKVSRRAVAYSPERIYADAAASTPLHPRVLARLVKSLGIYANPGALHKEAVAAKEVLEDARAEVAVAIGAHPDEIYFTASGTESNNLALLGTLRPLLSLCIGRKKSAHAITINIEHSSVLEPLEHLCRYGLELSVVPVEKDGVVLPEKIASTIRPETALISVQLVNSEIGTIQPIREIMKIVRRVRKERETRGNTTPLIIHTDAAQAALYLALRVEALGIDLMTLDAQKILGPKSVGALYVRRGIKIEPIMFGGAQEKGLRPGTPNLALAGAFAESLTLAQKDVEVRAKKVAMVRDALVQYLRLYIPNIEFNGSMEEGKRVANNINVSVPRLEGETAVIALDSLGVCASTRSACSNSQEHGSHVLNALGLPNERSAGAIRLTLLPNTNKTEARHIAQALTQVRALYGKTTLG